MEVLGMLWIPDWQLLVLAIILTYTVYMSKDHYIFRSIGVKGPMPLPIFGNFFTLWKKRSADILRVDVFHLNILNVETMDRMRRGMRNGASTLISLDNSGILGIQYAERDWLKEYGNVFGMYEGKSPVLVVADPDMLREILVKKFHCFRNRRRLTQKQEPPLDSLLTVLKDEQWKHVRNTLTPTFSGGKLKKMISLINGACDKLVEKLEGSAEKKEDVEIKLACGAFTMDVIASTLFGIQIDSQTNPDDPFVVNGKRFMNIRPSTIVTIIFFPFLLPIMNAIGLPVFERNAWKFFENATIQSMEERKTEMTTEGNKQKRRDFLQLMIDEADEAEAYAAKETEEDAYTGKTSNTKENQTNDSRGLTFNEILGQAIIFFIAGYETTAATLSFVLYNLALNPDATEKTIQEIDEVVGKGNVSYEQIAELHYLEKVVLETQRMYPAAVRFDRVCNETTTIGDLTIPKGMIVSVPAAAIHYNPKYWTEPSKFDPERFSSEKKAERNPFHYMPFGYGPRNCIGMRLALLEMKMAVVRILQKLRPVKVERTMKNPPLSKLGFLQIKGGSWIGFEMREQQ